MLWELSSSAIISASDVSVDMQANQICAHPGKERQLVLEFTDDFQLNSRGCASRDSTAKKTRHRDATNVAPGNPRKNGLDSAWNRSNGGPLKFWSPRGVQTARTGVLASNWRPNHFALSLVFSLAMVCK